MPFQASGPNHPAEKMKKIFSSGLCIGTTIGFDDNGDKADCNELCQETEGCEYYTYDSADSACLVYEDCLRFDESCTTCTTAENECPPILCNQPGGCVGILVGFF